MLQPQLLSAIIILQGINKRAMAPKTCSDKDEENVLLRPNLTAFEMYDSKYLFKIGMHYVFFYHTFMVMIRMNPTGSQTCRADLAEG